MIPIWLIDFSSQDSLTKLVEASDTLLSCEEGTHPHVAPRVIRVVINGFGGVGRILFECLERQKAHFSDAGLEIRVVGLTDSRGFCINNSGINFKDAIAAKKSNQSVSSLVGGSTEGRILDSFVSFDLWYEAGPTEKNRNALDLSLEILNLGKHIVFTNKSPVAFGYFELLNVAKAKNCKFRFSSCVGGALPTVNLGMRDLRGSGIVKIESVLNLCTNKILKLMEQGSTLEEAKIYLKSKGLLETDPSNDVDGWDSAFKLLIVAQSVLGAKVNLDDIERVGIGSVKQADILTSESRMVLLCLAERKNDSTNQNNWKFSVKPTLIPLSSPLARMTGDEMGILFESDISGTIFASSFQSDAYPTAGAMIRDTFDILMSDN